MREEQNIEWVRMDLRNAKEQIVKLEDILRVVMEYGPDGAVGLSDEEEALIAHLRGPNSGGPTDPNRRL